MKLTTIALAIAFAFPSTFALAEGSMNLAEGSTNLGSHVARPFTGVTVARPMATRPRNFSGNTLAPIMHDPSGSTLTPSAMSRGG
ncbi:MAG: hypothetical protein JWP25_4470 [Bradyrhizobium sp.]|jgi:hypothetical protein|nr:hypothetical protein [Bradyrhizobium sp.]